MSITIGARRPAGERDRGRVVVVGGGLAGIAAALDCAAGGAHVTLLEARPRLGGAAYSVHHNGLRVDNGQHVFLRCCTEYLGLLGRLGALDGVTLQPRLEIPVLAPGSGTVWLRRSGLPAPAHLARSLLGYRFLSVREHVARRRRRIAILTARRCRAGGFSNNGLARRRRLNGAAYLSPRSHSEFMRSEVVHIDDVQYLGVVIPQKRGFGLLMHQVKSRISHHRLNLPMKEGKSFYAVLSFAHLPRQELC